MKNYKVIILNILFILIIFFIADYAVFSSYKKEYKFDSSYISNMTKKIAISDEFDREYLLSQELPPAFNEENTDYKSIIFTGCSFIYGAGLEENQTISYKTALLLKNPIYNISYRSRAINTIYAAVDYGVFDKVVKVKPKTILYNYADFHLQRLLMPNVFFEGNEFLYRLQNGILVRKRPPFVISRFPLFCIIRENLHYYFLNNNLYRDYLKQLLKVHFISMKNLLHSKYGAFKFVILVYTPSPIFEEISIDLEKEGFIILRVKEDFQIDVENPRNKLPDNHPSENAWDEIVLKLVKYL